ncbi:hypothetical protein [Nostoc sp.]
MNFAFSSKVELLERCLRRSLSAAVPLKLRGASRREVRATPTPELYKKC